MKDKPEYVKRDVIVNTENHKEQALHDYEKSRKKKKKKK